MGQAGDVVFGGDKGDAESEDAGSDVACLSDAMHPPYNGNSIIYERVCELVFFFFIGVFVSASSSALCPGRGSVGCSEWGAEADDGAGLWNVRSFWNEYIY